VISIGLTGNVASGKSTVAEMWSGEGIPVINADDLSRKAVEPGSSGLAAIVQRFGSDIVDEAGILERGALRGIVFRDDGARSELEAILHPRIAVLRDRWLNECHGRRDSVVVSEIPLLFEVGLESEFDVTVFVDVDEAERLRRLVQDRGLEESEARRILQAQMDPALKRDRADHVLTNNGSVAELRAAALRLLTQIRSVAGAQPSSSSRAPEGRMRVDMHMHTRASFDCLSDPDEVLARALARGVDRIAITDHNSLGLALEMHARHPDRVIPGEEVKTAEGIDVIGYYLTEEIPKGTPAREVCALVREQGGLSYLPHPFAAGKGGGGKFAEEFAPLVDIVEVFNARLHPGRLNVPAEELAERHQKPRGAGSDAHTVAEVAGAWVEVPKHENRPAALLEALQSARVRGIVTPWAVHLASTWAKIRKKLP
jgi:dephospho-CoA kinase